MEMERLFECRKGSLTVTVSKHGGELFIGTDECPRLIHITIHDDRFSNHNVRVNVKAPELLNILRAEVLKRKEEGNERR